MTTPRIRITDNLRRQADNTLHQIMRLFHEAQKHGTPLNKAANKARAIRTEREWPPSLSWDLYTQATTLWQYMVQTEANWVLYLDDQPITSNEISAKRQAGDENVWSRVYGLMEWKSHPRKPFYDDVAPKYLGPEGKEETQS